MSAAYEDTVRSKLESLENKVRRDAARAHDPDNPDVWGILQPAHSRQISSGICTPVAAEGNDFRFELLRHGLSFLEAQERLFCFPQRALQSSRTWGSHGRMHVSDQESPWNLSLHHPRRGKILRWGNPSSGRMGKEPVSPLRTTCPKPPRPW